MEYSPVRIRMAATTGLPGFLLLLLLLSACDRQLVDGQVTAMARPAGQLPQRQQQQVAAALELRRDSGRQILFGDLHTHTSFSPDGFILGMPLTGGEGVRPPADACDYARYCSALDFWGISDHAEGLTPRLWSITRQSIEDCNQVSGDPVSPDLVSFLGYEWSHVALKPEQHYGHKNVFFRDTGADRTPPRAVAAPREQLASAPLARGAQLTLAALDWRHRDFYFGIQSYYDEIADTPVCAADVDSRELPANCLEIAHNPAELFAKLDSWGYPALVIPHGNAWGMNTPPLTRWDKQLTDQYQAPDYQKLIEIYSGHGNSEEFRPWNSVQRDQTGQLVCPAPREDFLPCCWRAGQLIEARCEDPDSAACAARVAKARKDYVDAGISGHLTVPGAEVTDWLNCGQCEDCFNPAFKLRGRASAQYALTLNRAGNQADRQNFRFGFIGSSDNHRARAGNGYKESGRRAGNTETMGAVSKSRINRNPNRGDRAEKSSRRLEELGAIGLNELRNMERQQSFYLTGGLVAAHSEGRGREAIWEALNRKQVYATSGDRILLWFDLLDEEQGKIPMGSEVSRGSTPRFRVSAAGALRQLPGCPEYVTQALGAARQRSLCANECYHPGDRRKGISRIEVVRIRPRQGAHESARELIEDPWKVLPCEPASAGCSVEFEDPEFPRQQREMIYYVRAIQEPSPAVNAGGLRCEYNERGECVEVNPCYGDFRTDFGDDCLSPNEERAWSSPIYIDYRR